MAGSTKFDRKKIEAWLEQSLVPVEPSPAFVRRLRARLVTVQGDRMFSPWMLILILASMLILIATWLGLGMRLLLALLSLFGLMERRRRQTPLQGELIEGSS